MKKLNRFVMKVLPALSLITLTSCAAGAATAAYSLKAQTSDGLTSEAEQRIVNRTKMEIMSELSKQQPCSMPYNQAQ